MHVLNPFELAHISTYTTRSPSHLQQQACFCVWIIHGPHVHLHPHSLRALCHEVVQFVLIVAHRKLIELGGSAKDLGMRCVWKCVSVCMLACVRCCACL